MGTYYKIANPSGWDFFTGKTINYRDALTNGGLVVPPNANPKANLCSPGVLHASKVAEHCFIGGRVPCSLFRIEGSPVVEEEQTAGFVELWVLEELDPAQHFKWRYAEAANPVDPLLIEPQVGAQAKELLHQWASVWESAWPSVWASVRASVRAPVGPSVWPSVWASVRASVGPSVWASVGASVRASFEASVRASAWAYVGYLFSPVVETWVDTKHPDGTYPFQAAVDLWHKGLVPSFDGKTWRLHGHEDARVLFEITQEELTAKPHIGEA